MLGRPERRFWLVWQLGIIWLFGRTWQTGQLVIIINGVVGVRGVHGVVVVDDRRRDQPLLVLVGEYTLTSEVMRDVNIATVLEIEAAGGRPRLLDEVRVKFRVLRVLLMLVAEQLQFCARKYFSNKQGKVNLINFLKERE